jgi:tetratricopeptide (TPR) repeat protein
MSSRTGTVRGVAVALLMVGLACVFASGCQNVRARRNARAADLKVTREDPTEAYAQYEAAVTDATATKNWGLVGHSLLQMAGIHQKRGQFDDAEKKQVEALEAFEKAKDVNGQAACIHEMGALHMAKGQYPEAETLLRHALAMREEVNTDKEGIAATYNELGSVCLRTDRADEAKKLYQTALDLRTELGIKWQIAETTHNIGAVYHAELRDEWVYTGDQPQLNEEEKGKDWFDYRYRQALDYYGKALKIFDRLGERWWVAQLHYQIGCVHICGARRDLMDERCRLAREEFDKSLAVHDGLRVANREGLRPNEKPDYAFLVDIGWLYHSYGSSYHVQGRLRDALDWYHKALPVWDQLKDRTALSATQHEIGGVYQLMHNVPVAISWYKKALKIREEELKDDHMAAYTYYEMGNTYGGGPLAIMCWEAALERAERPEIRDIHLESGCRIRLGLPQRDHSMDPESGPPMTRTDTEYQYTEVESEILREAKTATEKAKEPVKVKPFRYAHPYEENIRAIEAAEAAEAASTGRGGAEQER